MSNPVTAPALLGDIGGTNSRFAIAGKDPAELQAIQTYQNNQFYTFEDVLGRALDDLQISPKRVVLAVAGPVADHRAILTNRQWAVDATQLSERINGADVRVINDFQALAQSLPFLSGEGLETLAPGQLEAGGHKLVLGAGTGLGVGLLLRANDQWMAIPGEGGHVSLPVQTPREFDLFCVVGRALSRVSAEQMISGPGLVSLCNAVLELDGAAERFAEPYDVLNACKMGVKAAVEAAEIFIKILGRLAGDFALTFLPRGGIYLGGGVTPRVIEVVGPEAFLSEMHNKGRVSRSIADIPVYMIKDGYPELIGCGAYIEQSSSDCADIHVQAVAEFI